MNADTESLVDCFCWSSAADGAGCGVCVERVPDSAGETVWLDDLAGHADLHDCDYGAGVRFVLWRALVEAGGAAGGRDDWRRAVWRAESFWPAFRTMGCGGFI